jgi:hypothetical protein
MFGVNEATIVFVPEFDVQAKFLLVRPPSLAQFVQARLSWLAEASVADSARRAPQSRMTFFIVASEKMQGQGGVVSVAEFEA